MPISTARNHSPSAAKPSPPIGAFALRAVKEAGVASIPVSALYEEDHVTTILRLCLAKNDQTLDEGVRRLAKARELSRRA